MNSAQSLESLGAARSLALSDGRYYPTILPGVLPIIGASATLEVKRWGADFLAETFASPTWTPELKAQYCLTALPTLQDYIESQDTSIVKSAIQAAACIYPLVYKHIISNSHDSQNWQLMVAIKTNILRRMDTAPPGVRVCCVKFVQQVVLVQTPGIVDPRRLDQSDVSLAHVPRDHPLIPYGNLEAESSGLLDRLLDIIHGDHSDVLLVTATLNSLGVLIQRRPIVANKVLTSVLNFNPLKLANSPMTPKIKVLIRSLERTVRALLVNVMKRNPENPFSTRIQQYIERMHRMRLEVFDESNRKRPAPSEPTDGLDPAKRQRLEATVPSSTPPIPPLPPGPVSYRQLFTLNPDASTANFDVQVFQDRDQLLRILIPILHSIDETKLNNAINAVRSRYVTLCQDASRNAIVNEAAVDDEDEYEPDFEPEDAEQVINRLDSAPPDDLVAKRVPDGPIAPYKLPEAPPLTPQEVQRYGDETVRRVFGMLSAIDEPTKAKGTKGGFNRLAASNFDRDSWITIMARLATRASSGLDDPQDGIKSEYNDVVKKGSFSLSETIRDGLYNYIMYDWKRRIDLAINWLNEEWYNDRLQAEAARKNAKAMSNGDAAAISEPRQNYHRCALRLLDGIIAYIEGTDKILVRFISEIPEVDRVILQRMKKMAEDPERIDLSIMTLQYLYMFRPPVREICVDVLEDMWRTNDRAKPSARKLLTKWRPHVLESENEVKMETANGALEVKPVA